VYRGSSVSGNNGFCFCMQGAVFCVKQKVLIMSLGRSRSNDPKMLDSWVSFPGHPQSRWRAGGEWEKGKPVYLSTGYEMLKIGYSLGLEYEGSVDALDYKHIVGEWPPEYAELGEADVVIWEDPPSPVPDFGRNKVKMPFHFRPPPLPEGRVDWVRGTVHACRRGREYAYLGRGGYWVSPVMYCYVEKAAPTGYTYRSATDIISGPNGFSAHVGNYMASVFADHGMFDRLEIPGKFGRVTSGWPCTDSSIWLTRAVVLRVLYLSQVERSQMFLLFAPGSSLTQRMIRSLRFLTGYRNSALGFRWKTVRRSCGTKTGCKGMSLSFMMGCGSGIPWEGCIKVVWILTIIPTSWVSRLWVPKMSPVSFVGRRVCRVMIHCL